MNLNIICAEVEKIARSVGAFLKSEQAKLRNTDIELKGTRNFVTYIDTEAEKMLVENLRGLIPGATFLTEEGTVSYAEGKYTWIIDPLDGTTNYVHGDTPYSVSIALMKDKQAVLGVVYDPVADELFSAAEKGKATLNGNPIKVSSHNTLTNGYIGFGIPYSLDARGEKILQNAIEQFRHCSFRIKGSAAAEICYVACGRSDAYFHSGLSPWDVAAGTFILECAGGKNTDFSGGNGYIFSKELVASNGAIHKDIVEQIVNY
ncbi:MAG: inositol monophosphatase family protein [Bacteroidia bacterium]|nr:inositol monophosphatase family protein [Bacteroidia bacterium]